MHPITGSEKSSSENDRSEKRSSEINTSVQFAPELFEPAPARPLVDSAAQPSASFWSTVLRRLRRDARAWFSLIVIVVMLCAALFGPLMWRIDPAQQILGAAAQGPTSSQRAVLVRSADIFPIIEPRDENLLPAAELPAPDNLQILEANTERVVLRWQAVPGAQRYEIYRHTHRPSSRTDLGLPLGFTLQPGQVSFSDGLQLRQREYFYSVIASDGIASSDRFATISVTPQAAIGWLEAQLQRLIPADADPSNSSLDSVVLPAHPLGTDHLGRDMLARLLQGARVSLLIAVSAAVLYVGLGLIYGAVAGFIGDAVDHWMMRFADFIVALPFLLFMILLRIMFGIGPGESGVLPLVIALVILSWPASARLVRGQMLQLREEPYIDAARLAGASGTYIVLRHVLPNMLGVVLVALTFAIPNAIFIEAFLSFIGMGVSPPATSWGAMSNDGVQNLFVHPTELLWPAACISITVLAFNLFGDALRDALDIKDSR